VSLHRLENILLKAWPAIKPLLTEGKRRRGFDPFGHLQDISKEKLNVPFGHALLLECCTLVSAEGTFKAKLYLCRKIISLSVK
jgi:hypothetical protein